MSAKFYVYAPPPLTALPFFSQEGEWCENHIIHHVHVICWKHTATVDAKSHKKKNIKKKTDGVDVNGKGHGHAATASKKCHKTSSRENWSTWSYHCVYARNMNFLVILSSKSNKKKQYISVFSEPLLNKWPNLTIQADPPGKPNAGRRFFFRCCYWSAALDEFPFVFCSIHMSRFQSLGRTSRPFLCLLVHHIQDCPSSQHSERFECEWRATSRTLQRFENETCEQNGICSTGRLRGSTAFYYQHCLSTSVAPGKIRQARIFFSIFFSLKE